MFDNPKKELERLEQQLLAASRSAEEPEDDGLQDEYDDAYDEYEEYEESESFDEELYEMLNGPRKVNYDDRRRAREFSRRSSGFDADMEEYEMERDRYVPAPKKKSLAWAVFVAVLELAVAIGLILWWAQHLGWLK